METHTIFVYGTLMRGESRDSMLDQAEFLGSAVTVEGFDLISLGSFPGMVEGTGKVHGELYRVDAPTVMLLDKIEGHPKFYRRVLIELEDGRTAMAYILPAKDYAGHTLVPSGDWKTVVRFIPGT